jgi:hypothetical protein
MTSYRYEVELWLWARDIVGVGKAITDEELIAGIAGKDPARQFEVQQHVRAGAKGGKRAPLVGLFWQGRSASGAPFQRVWGIPKVGEPPPHIALILRRRRAQHERNKQRDRASRNARERLLYAESAERREKAKQTVYRWRKSNARND